MKLKNIFFLKNPNYIKYKMSDYKSTRNKITDFNNKNTDKRISVICRILNKNFKFCLVADNLGDNPDKMSDNYNIKDYISCRYKNNKKFSVIAFKHRRI